MDSPPFQSSCWDSGQDWRMGAGIVCCRIFVQRNSDPRLIESSNSKKRTADKPADSPSQIWTPSQIFTVGYIPPKKIELGVWSLVFFHDVISKLAPFPPKSGPPIWTGEAWCIYMLGSLPPRKKGCDRPMESVGARWGCQGMSRLRVPMDPQK